MTGKPAKQIETFINPSPDRDYTITIQTEEFTCLCPLTGQPDFAKIKIQYIPAQLCIELKSLKNYFWSFRDQGAFHEKISNDILNTLCTILQPRFMCLTAQFNIRGGLSTEVIVEHTDPNWKKDAANS